MSKKAKADKRKNPKYDQLQSIYVDGADPEKQLKELLDVKPGDKKAAVTKR